MGLAGGCRRMLWSFSHLEGTAAEMIGGGIFRMNEVPDSDVGRSSNRRFGLTFAGVGLTVGVAKLWWGEKHGVGLARRRGEHS